MNPNKVICKCKNVTKGEVLEAMRKGASSYREVKDITGAGAKCGKCKKKVKKFMNRHKEIEEQPDILTEE